MSHETEVSKNQWNELVKLIVTHGLNPQHFGRNVTPENMGYQYVIEYTQEKPDPSDDTPDTYRFVVHSDHYQGNFRVGSYPLIGNPTFLGEVVYGWESVVESFSTWLHRMRAEVEEPDLWALYEKIGEDADEVAKSLIDPSLIIVPNGRDTALSHREYTGLADKITQIEEALSGLRAENKRGFESVCTALEGMRLAGESRPRSAITHMLMLALQSAVSQFGSEIGGQVADAFKEHIIPIIVGTE